MSLLFKHLRVHQVFGANTDVGKTILTTALVRASASRNTPVFYLKPVSTGPLEAADDLFIKRNSQNLRNIKTECLYRLDEPVSPHLAARQTSGFQSPSTETFVSTVSNHIRRCANQSSSRAHLYVETAGGVHSPSLNGASQLESYRPLFLPTVLVGDSKLGGISTTISAFESLLLRGFIVDAVLVFRDEYYRNWEYLQSYFQERHIPLLPIAPPPPRSANEEEDIKLTDNYFASLSASPDQEMSKVIDHLDSCHDQRLQEIDSMPSRTLDTIWWPFVQHGLNTSPENISVIDSAYSDFFSVRKPQSSETSSILSPEFDGSASWWTQTFGHADSSLTLAAAAASGRYGHVMFPQATHLPALRLAERLIKDGPGKGWASRAFFSDDGSTGMEVALKMALRAFTKRYNTLGELETKQLGVLGLKGSYHGDTIGAMDACEEGVYTCEWHNAKGYWFDPPSIGIKDGKVTITIPKGMAVTSDIPDDAPLSRVYDVPARLQTAMALQYREYIRSSLDKIQASGGPTLAALVIEPLVMGAGGMIFVDPLFQRVLIDVVRGTEPTAPSQWSGLPVIFDEVFVGLYRIGMQSTGPLLGVSPDISVHAKILTGGLVPMAVTLATDSIFRAFWSDKKADALLHGHSYTAHPIGCAVANQTLDNINKIVESEHWRSSEAKWKAEGNERIWSLWDPTFVKAVSASPKVDEVMALGTVLAIKVKDDRAGYVSQSAENVFLPIRQTLDDKNISMAPGGAPFGIHFRTLGDVAYFMTSLNTSALVIQSIEDRIWAALSDSNQKSSE